MGKKNSMRQVLSVPEIVAPVLVNRCSIVTKGLVYGVSARKFPSQLAAGGALVLQPPALVADSWRSVAFRL
jgi:hypothetical protein